MADNRVKTNKMLTGLTVIAYIVLVLGALLPIISALEGKKAEGWFTCVLLLGAFILCIVSVLRMFDKRLTEIENHLRSQ